MKRWINGMKNLSYVRQLQAQKAGLIGNIIGLTSAFIFLLVMKQYIWLIVVACSCWLQVIELIRVNQQYVAALEMEKIKKDMEAGKI